MQFLRDREIGTRGAKQRLIIDDDNDDEKEYWFGQLEDETMHIDFVRNFGGEKCVEVMITDKLVMPYYCEENPAKKMFRDLSGHICVISYATPVKSAL
ncbi:hypothetical protein G5I_04206 [Acromyrmex echinatior]|uniref:Uncharacterized protein n=1 Tax=Acromyrmex echinatior TaxID=103372 RepID=F4WF00_ACREC|nr:hypothetical protein G5I_04206 [Acromyrmex echinatior]